ncbi:MAG: hypothetical protein HYV63_03010 [Candidatus Schekmanbacteria bacterium]|nr:hypothetical protein [Candidatus Schekmanbacteria bacterium]
MKPHHRSTATLRHLCRSQPAQVTEQRTAFYLLTDEEDSENPLVVLADATGELWAAILYDLAGSCHPVQRVSHDRRRFLRSAGLFFGTLRRAGTIDLVAEGALYRHRACGNLVVTRGLWGSAPRRHPTGRMR